MGVKAYSSSAYRMHRAPGFPAAQYTRGRYVSPFVGDFPVSRGGRGGHPMRVSWRRIRSVFRLLLVRRPLVVRNGVLGEFLIWRGAVRAAAMGFLTI